MKIPVVLMLCVALSLASVPTSAFALRPIAFGVRADEARYKAAYQQMPKGLDVSQLGLMPDIVQSGESAESRKQASNQVRSLITMIVVRVAAYAAVLFIISIAVKYGFLNPWLAALVGGVGILYDVTMNLVPEIEQGYEDARAREIHRRSYRDASIDRQISVNGILSTLYNDPETSFTQAELIERAGKHAVLSKLSAGNIARILEALCRNGYVLKLDDSGAPHEYPASEANFSSAGSTEDVFAAPSGADDVWEIVAEACRVDNAYDRNNVFAKRIAGFDQAKLRELLYILINYNSIDAITIPEQEALYLLGKVLSEALSGTYRNEFIIELKNMFSKKPDTIPPKSSILIESFITIAEINKPAVVTTVYAMHGEQTRMQSPSAKHGGQDALRLKAQQNEDLYRVNPLVDWRMIAVNDGDNHTNQYSLKSSDVTLFLLKRFYPQYLSLSEKGISRIQVLELKQDTREAIGSVKGGAIIYGIRKALTDGADYVIYTDQDGSVSLEEEGALLKPILSGNASASIGLRHDHPAAIPRPLMRRFKHRVFLMFTKLNMRYVSGMKDTQAGFKAFSRELLLKILPLNTDMEFDPQFEYGGSFDVNLLGRAKKAGACIAQVPICYFESEASKFSGLDKTLNMAKGIRRIRRHLKQWNAPAISLHEPAPLPLIDSAA